MRLGANRFAALLAIFALVASSAFAFSSHSARFDMATGFAVLGYLSFLLRTFDDRERITLRTIFVITFLACISLAIYVHVPTLIVLPALYTLWRIGIFTDAKRLITAIFGAAIGCLSISTACFSRAT